jgi:hypothetical protein
VRRAIGSPGALASSFNLLLIAAALSGLVASALIHDARALLGSLVDPQHPTSIYQQLTVPGTSRLAGAPGAAGADFAQVYWSGLALRNGESAYDPTTPAFRDIFGPQRAAYPPLMNWFYVPLTYLRYGDALLAHTLLTLAVLLGVTGLVLWRMQLRSQIALVMLAQLTLFLLTPIGFTHLERGQFDLYVTSAAALCVACSAWPGAALGLAIASGLLGALKWTSLSFLGCFCVFGGLLGPRRTRAAFVAVPVVFLLVTEAFYGQLHEYWAVIHRYELTVRPYGVTLQSILPRPLARLAPILATLLPIAVTFGWKPARARREIAFRAGAGPFALALMSLSICFGSLGFEYHTVATLGMLPGLVVWLVREPLVPLRLKQITAGLYALYLILAFRVFERVVSLQQKQVLGLHVTCALVLLAICVWAIRDAVLRDASEPATPRAT